MENNSSIEAVRHSLAHLLAYSVKQLYPGSQNAIGPAIENGFYQDFEANGTISEEDLPKIEAKMKEVLNSWQGFERKEVNLDEALEIFADNKYKQELAREFAEGGKTLTIYTSGDFVDLCKGGHVNDIGSINPDAFKVTKTAGAYWRGDEKNKMLTRIYGIAFATEQDLADYLHMQEEAKKRDHRKLGKELDLFTFSDLVGSGLPLYTPRGTVLIEELKRALKEISQKYDMQMVSTPHIAKLELYKTSGHADKFSEELLHVTSHYDQQFVMKPVSCPHHIQIYASRPRSYKELPFRYIEQTMQYRDEKPGQIGGLQRVRGFTVDDGHTFCRVDQIETEAGMIAEIIQEFYQSLGLWGKHWVSLSVRDPKKPENYIGEPSDWDQAEQMLQTVSDSYNLQAKRMEGEAAIYGPKLDFMFQDSLGRETQLATIQLDFAMPKRFELRFIDSDGSEKIPVMIHRAILGSFERFIMILIEHFAGKFPVWLAPEQLRIIQVKDSGELDNFIDKIVVQARENGIRLYVDRSNESVGKKIRAAEMMKVPYSVVVGEKELEIGRLTPRIRADLAVEGRSEQSIPPENLIQSIANEAKARAQKSSL